MTVFFSSLDFHLMTQLCHLEYLNELNRVEDVFDTFFPKKTVS